ncbi:MAG: hypothetical protein IKE28_12740 [Solobacterium sp.]|nr:hypothetical protein [Solobacterium sp.]
MESINEKIKYVQATIISFTYFQSIDELRAALSQRRTDNLSTILKSVFVNWTVPRWSHQDDIVLFLYSKNALNKIRTISKQIGSSPSRSRPMRSRFSISPSKIAQDLEAYEKYGGKIMAIGRILDDPEPGTFSGGRHATATITDIHILDNPLPVSKVTSFLRISQGGETPIWGEWYERIKQMIISTNSGLPSYFINSVSMTEDQSKINSSNWLEENLKNNFNYRKEEEFRTFYIDYLLRLISDDNSFYTECACYKEGLKYPSYADYIIQINNILLPVEAKINIKIEQDIDGQVEKYCDLTKVIPDTRTGEVVDHEKLNQSHVMIIDERCIQMYDYHEKIRSTITSLDELKTEKDVIALRERIINMLAYE